MQSIHGIRNLRKLFIIIASLILLNCQIAPSTKMNIVRQFKNLTWYKPDWSYMFLSKETKDSLKQCSRLHPVEFSLDIEDLIKRSKSFPIPFPIETVRLEKLKSRRPAQKLTRNIVSTYPVLHERVLVLMANFLNYKREFGSDVERVLYRNMSVPQLVDRILTKRAVTFMNSYDSYLLLTGEEGSDGWESVGTPEESPPLVLEACLSYDEMKLSALVFVSGYTECVNSGSRQNEGVVSDDDIEQEAVIIGVIGTRLEREGRMDWEDILVTRQQNREENGYGRASKSPKQEWRRLWSQFYQVPSVTYDEVSSSIPHGTDEVSERYVRVTPEVIFDNEVYYKRVRVLAETTLLEAQARGNAAGRDVYVNIIGAGLGVWKISPHQTDVYVLTFVQTVRALLQEGSLAHVTDVNFAYVRPGASVLGLFENSTAHGGSSNASHMFLASEKHPKGGINVQLENREPSSKLLGQHAGKLLVITYPWDGNAHPGNEFWLGSLSGSGDPAATCSTQVAELHNAHINPVLTGLNTRVVGRTGLSTLSDCCLALTA